MKNKAIYEAPKLEEHGKYTVITGGSEEIFSPDFFEVSNLPTFEDLK